jgi:ParB family chromosome partitioning protein
VGELEALLAQAGQARTRVERDLAGRLAAAEARAAEAARRIEQLAAERREAEARAGRAVEEAQARFRDELARRDQLRAQEVVRLQAALQQGAKREKALEMEVQRVRGPRNLVPSAPSVQPPAPPEEKATAESIPGPGKQE